MKKLRNPNHPKKGSSITVEPIKRIKDTKLIKMPTSAKRGEEIFNKAINIEVRSEILEYSLRNAEIPAIVQSGNYDTIIQDSEKHSSFLSARIPKYTCRQTFGNTFPAGILFLRGKC